MPDTILDNPNNFYAVSPAKIPRNGESCVDRERMVPEISVQVDSWFSAGVVVSFVDEYGVEYRGALLKRTGE